MADWTRVEKPDWESDVGIVKELNDGLRAMDEADSLEALLGHYDAQRENVKYLMPAGRAKWEQAYAHNVLRLTRPKALRPEQVYVVTTTKTKPGGEFEFPDTHVCDSWEAAVRLAITNLILDGELYVNMCTPDLTELKAAVDAGKWQDAYEVLKKRLKHAVVRIAPAAIFGNDPEMKFTIVPTAAAARPPWPSIKVKHSAIEERFGSGGRGSPGAYLVAEVGELAAMLKGYGAMSDKAVADALVRIADVVTDSDTPNEPNAVRRWRDHAAEMYDEVEEGA